MLVSINADNPQAQRIQQAVDVLKKGGVIVYPTDTVYALGCDMYNQKAVEQICRIKGINPEKAYFSLICADISNISEFTKQFDNRVFKLMKKTLPGPFTYILEANNKVPKILQAKKKTVGIRIPDHEIPLELVRVLGNPIITTSIKDEDQILEYSTDPELIFERFEKTVDMVIDGGYGNLVASTVVDCSGKDITIIRQGLGEIESLL